MKKMKENNDADSRFSDILKADEINAYKKAKDEFKVEIDFAEKELNLFLKTFQRPFSSQKHHHIITNKTQK